MYTNGKLKFYPKHPSDNKTHQIETTAMSLLEQEAPFCAKTLCDEFKADADRFFAKYVDKRFEITGIAKKIGPDIHYKPSIEISDSINGQTYALVIFPTDDHYSKVEVGDTVVVRANYLVMSNHYGTVMKYSELVSVKKKEESPIQQDRIILNYPLFDGKKVIENASVVMENGVITQIKLKIILGHWGELVSFFMYRLDEMMDAGVKLKKTFSDSFKENIYVNPSGMLYAEQLRYCLDTFGVDHILWGGRLSLPPKRGYPNIFGRI